VVKFIKYYKSNIELKATNHKSIWLISIFGELNLNKKAVNPIRLKDT